MSRSQVRRQFNVAAFARMRVPGLPAFWRMRLRASGVELTKQSSRRTGVRATAPLQARRARQGKGLRREKSLIEGYIRRSATPPRASQCRQSAAVTSTATSNSAWNLAHTAGAIPWHGYSRGPGSLLDSPRVAGVLRVPSTDICAAACVSSVLCPKRARVRASGGGVTPSVQTARRSSLGRKQSDGLGNITAGGGARPACEVAGGVRRSVGLPSEVAGGVRHGV